MQGQWRVNLSSMVGRTARSTRRLNILGWHCSRRVTRNWEIVTSDLVVCRVHLVFFAAGHSRPICHMRLCRSYNGREIARAPKTVGDVSFFCRAREASSSASSRVSKVVGSPSQRVLLREARIGPRFVTKCLKTLHKPRNAQSSVTFFGYLRSRLESIVYDDICRQPIPITWPM